MEPIETIPEIKKHFFSLFPQNYSELKLPIRYGIHDIARRISICRCGKEDENHIPKIQNSIRENFDITPQGASRKQFHYIARKYTRSSQPIFMEPRYFTLETCIEFGIAAGMSDAVFYEFCKIIMGMNWIYLRNIEYLIGTYCIKYGLQPDDYYELTKYARELKIQNQNEPLETQITVSFHSELNDFEMEVTEKYGTDPHKIKKEIIQFVKDHMALIRSQTSRTQNTFLKECCVRFLEPKDYPELQREIKNLKKEIPKEPMDAAIPDNFKETGNQFFIYIEKELIQKRESIKRELKDFLEEHILKIQGKITRTLETVRRIIDHPKKNSWLSKVHTPRRDFVEGYIAAVSFSWEYKKTDTTETNLSVKEKKNRFDKQNMKKILNIKTPETKFQTQIEKYFSPKEKLFSESSAEKSLAEKSRNVDLGRDTFTENFVFEKMNMRRLRNDFIKIMIMNFTASDSLAYMNNRLKEHSFYPLRDDDPFDYLVVSAIKIYKGEDKQKEFQNKEPYEILAALFSAVKRDGIK